MATKLSMTRDINGYNAFGLIPSDTQFSATLSESTDTTLTIPSTMGMGGNGISTTSLWLAVINYSDPSGYGVWVAYNATAAAPAGTSFASTTSALYPEGLQVKGGDVLHFFTSGSGVQVGVRLYAIS